MITIKSIKEVSDDRYDGYEIACDDGTTYSFLIHNWQSCCESWGYFSSEDDLQSFAGANLLDIRVTDTALKNTELKMKQGYLTVGDCIFVTVKTDRGDFQLTVYNSHNGYYGHEVFFKRGEKVLLETGI